MNHVNISQNPMKNLNLSLKSALLNLKMNIMMKLQNPTKNTQRYELYALLKDSELLLNLILFSYFRYFLYSFFSRTALRDRESPKPHNMQQTNSTHI